MNLKRSRRVFSGLNIQFIFYFLLFAYVPLLVFSIIGYYLNKSSIRHVHEQNLNEVTAIAIDRLTDYFDALNLSTRNEFSHAHNQLLLTGRKKIFHSNFLKSWFIQSFAVFKKDRSLLTQTGCSSTLLQQFRISSPDSSHLLYDKDTHSLFLLIQLPVGYRAWLRLPEQSIARRLKSYNNEIQFLLFNKHKQFFTSKKFAHRKVSEINPFLSRILFPGPPYIETKMNLDAEWSLVSRKPKLLVYGDLIHFLQQIFIANLIIGLLMLIVAILQSRRITGPIQDLVAAANVISNGDLRQPIHIQARDEIKILADEFEQMRQKLQESYANLESKVEERSQALREAQFQISHQEKMASLGLLAAGVAHEIGNPLTSISSMAQIIKRRVKSDQITQYLDTILKNIDRISKIVRELVDFSRPSSYKATYVDVNEIIRHAVGIVKYDRRAKHVPIRMDLSNQLPTIYLVSDQLLQVFLNILINAVDALKHRSGKIDIRSELQEDHVLIQFKDNGSGIPEENLSKIFEPFYTTKKVGRGTGLGLSVSYGIIKNFNGNIHVESELKKGSTFIIEIPVKQMEKDES